MVEELKSFFSRPDNGALNTLNEREKASPSNKKKKKSGCSKYDTKLHSVVRLFSSEKSGVITLLQLLPGQLWPLLEVPVRLP